MDLDDGQAIVSHLRHDGSFQVLASRSAVEQQADAWLRQTGAGGGGGAPYPVIEDSYSALVIFGTARKVETARGGVRSQGPRRCPLRSITVTFARSRPHRAPAGTRPTTAPRPHPARGSAAAV